MHTKILSGSIFESTTPIEASYIAVGHTDCEADIRSMAGFVPTALYGQRKMIHESELGAVENTRYCLSPDLDPFIGAGNTSYTGFLNNGTRANVYPILYFGMHAYGTVPLRGEEAIEPSPSCR